MIKCTQCNENVEFDAFHFKMKVSERCENCIKCTNEKRNCTECEKHNRKFHLGDFKK